MAFKKGNTPYNFDDLTGKIFNRLTVVERVYKENTKRHIGNVSVLVEKKQLLKARKSKVDTPRVADALMKKTERTI